MSSIKEQNYSNWSFDLIVTIFIKSCLTGNYETTCKMTKFMIYGEPLKFDHLMKRILELHTRINGISQP